MSAATFEDVEVWKKAHAWVLQIYRFSEGFPRHELFGLTSQLRLDLDEVSRMLAAYVRLIPR